MDNIPNDIHRIDRLYALRRAANALSDAINAVPGTDGTTPAREYDALRHDDAPLDYLDDLDARVGVNVDRARALFTLATCGTDFFPDTRHDVAAMYPD